MTLIPSRQDAGSPFSATDIRDALNTQGYCWLADDGGYDGFQARCEELGEIVYAADVRMGGQRPRNYQLPGAIDFHTDHVSAQIVAWHCLQAEPRGGAMQLLDLKPLADALDPEDLAALGDVAVPDNAVWSQGGEIAMCWMDEGKPRFHYVPWLDLRPATSAAAAALQRLQTAISRARLNDLIEIDPAPGDAVIVDNHRIMHGRDAIPPHSARYLKRLWIREPV